MKKYKKLQQNVDKSFENICDAQLLESLKCEIISSERVKQKTKQKRFRVAIASSFIAIIIIIITIIGAPLLFRPNNEERHYFKDNENQIESTLEELNSFTNFIDLNSGIEWRVSKYIDILYNDTLYFIITWENSDTFEVFHISIIVNKDYKYKEDCIEYNNTQNMGNQKLLYNEKFEMDEDGLCFFTTYAKINTENESIYIKYEGIGFDGESTFLTSLSDLLVLQNNLI